MTPLVLIVGFLGAGKTSLMRELVAGLTKQGLRPHVVLNDFQNAGVDASYFEGLADTVAPINGSCVCCDSFEELIGVLEEQDLDEKSILLLEANGTTDSMELIEQLSLRPECARYTMPIQISVVDAKRWQKRSWHDRLEREQVATARYLRLTWQDAVSEGRLSGVRKWLKEKAPGAEILSSEALGETLVKTQQEAVAWPPRRLTARVEGHAGHGHEAHKHSHASEHRHEHSRYHFASWEHPLPDLVDPREFHEAFNDLPEEVLRCKGIVRLAEQGGRRLIFQKVGDGDLLATELNDDNAGIEPMIIFIGASLPVDELRVRIKRLEARAAPAALTEPSS